MAAGDSSDVDKAGQALLSLLHRSADALEHDHRQALQTAQKIGEQARAARDRITELENDIAHHRERAERAEEWLERIRAEIEEQFSTLRRTR
jgi:predicted  nucleic acid-binding Zn-ribbon protein